MGRRCAARSNRGAECVVAYCNLIGAHARATVRKEDADVCAASLELCGHSAYAYEACQSSDLSKQRGS